MRGAYFCPAHSQYPADGLKLIALLTARHLLAQQLQQLTMTTNALSRRAETLRSLRDASKSSAAAAMAQRAATEYRNSRALREAVSRQFRMVSMRG